MGEWDGESNYRSFSHSLLSNDNRDIMNHFMIDGWSKIDGKWFRKVGNLETKPRELSPNYHPGKTFRHLLLGGPKFAADQQFYTILDRTPRTLLPLVVWILGCHFGNRHSLFQRQTAGRDLWIRGWHSRSSNMTHRSPINVDPGVSSFDHSDGFFKGFAGKNRTIFRM